MRTTALGRPKGWKDAPSACRDDAGEGAGLYAGAALLWVGALLHLWAVPEGLLAWWAYGALSLGASLAQGLYAAVLLRWPTQASVRLGILGSASVVLLHVAVYAAGALFSASGAPGAGPPGTAAITVGLGTVIALLTLLAPERRDRVIREVVLLGGMMWTMNLAAALLP